MKHKRILALMLSLILIFSVFGFSCAEEPAPPAHDPAAGEADPPDGGQPADDGGEEAWPDGSGVAWYYNLAAEQKPYITQSVSDWITVCWGDKSDYDHNTINIRDRYWSEDSAPPTVKRLAEWSYVALYLPENYVEIYASDLVLPLEPYSSYTFNLPAYWSKTTVHKAVYDFLESGNTEERTYLLRFADAMYAEQDEIATLYRDALPDAEAVDGIGYVRWTGTAEELLRIADAVDSWIWVCFEEDLADVCGLTVEQAQALVANGHVTSWCHAFEESPLYGLTPDEIAAYLAEHPEILEE